MIIILLFVSQTNASIESTTKIFIFAHIRHLFRHHVVTIKSI